MNFHLRANVVQKFGMIKNLIIFLFVSLSFTKFLYADNSIEGLYSGNLIYPDGNRFPMVSEFKINENKGVWGNYRYIYEEKNYEGVFYKGKQVLAYYCKKGTGEYIS